MESIALADKDRRHRPAALRNWAVNLDEELTDVGIRSAHIGIDATIGTPTFYRQARVTADQIAPTYWELHTTRRDQAERIVRGWRCASRNPQTPPHPAAEEVS